jgi:large subunit ribosomal protein L4
MEVTQLTQTGQEKEKLNLNEKIFGGEVNEKLIAQYVQVHRERAALHTKKTKGRGEVSGGGHKPWRQKGTGRARHGSTRSPLWVGGGHTHPIVPTGFRRVRMSKAMRALAMVSTLSSAMKSSKLFFIDQIDLSNGKTREIVAVLKSLKMEKEKLVLVVSEKNLKLQQAVSNLPTVRVKLASVLSVVDIIDATKIVFIGDAYKVFEGGVK